MTIALTKNIGSNGQPNGSTVVITVPAAGVALGNVILARTGRASTEKPTGVADTGGNTYTQLVSYNAISPNIVIWIASVTTALVSGNTITATYSTMGTFAMVADEFSGVTITADQSNTAHNTSTTPSVAITPGALGLLIAAMVVNSGGPDTYTEDTDTDNGDSWHTLTRYNDGSNHAHHGAYKITTVAGLNTWNPSLGTSRTWSQILAGLTDATPASGNVSFPRRPSIRPAMFRTGLAR